MFWGMDKYRYRSNDESEDDTDSQDDEGSRLTGKIDISGLDNLRLWMDRMQERPACIKGCTVPPRADSSTQVKSAKSMIQK